MLELENVNAYYGDSHVLQGVSLTVNEGEVVCLLGRNGAGKTTTILATMGYLKPRPGRIAYRGRDIGALPPLCDLPARRRLRAAGARDIPEPHGAWRTSPSSRAAARDRRWTLPRVFELFPGSRRARAISGFSFRAASSRCCRSRGR